MREKHPDPEARCDGKAPNRTAALADKGPARVGRPRAGLGHYLGGLVVGALAGLLAAQGTATPGAAGWIATATLAAVALVALVLLVGVLRAAVRGRFAGRRFAVLLAMILGFGGGTVLPGSLAAAN